MPLTDAELDTLTQEVKKIPDLRAQLEAAVKQADRFGSLSQGYEATIKRLNEDLAGAKSAGAELEKRFNARADEIEVRLNRGQVNGNGAATKSNEADRKAFADYVRRGIIGPGLKAADAPEGKTLATNDGANGGFLVPSAMMGRLIEELVLVSPIRANAAPVTIGEGDALDLPRDEGSFTAGWVGETQARTQTNNSSYAKIRVQLREQYAFPKATQKMLDDASFDVEGYIARKMAEKFGQNENKAFILGDDVLQPEGITVNADVATVKTGSATALTADGLLDLIAALPTAFTTRASLFMNRKSMFAIRKLKDSQNRYLWEPGLPSGSATPGSGLTQALPGSFAGVPIVETPDVADVAASSKSVIYTDWRQSYQIVDKPTVGLLRDPYTDKPNVGFYATRRVGGRVVLPSAAKIQLTST